MTSSTMPVPQILAPNSPRQKISPVVGWHFDYQLRLGNIANGVQTPEIELLIEPGSPFCLRGIGGYSYVASGGGTIASPLTGAFLEYTDSQDNWLQTTLIGTNGDWNTFGQNAQYEPVYNQLVYGPGSVLSVRITNLSGANWTDARIVFRGTKLYYNERVYSRCYPPCYNALPWEQVLNIVLPASIAPPVQIKSIPVQAQGADIVIRGAAIANVTGNLQLIIRDQYEKPYANDYIAAQWLMPVGLANRPGTWYPELYIPKDRMILVDALQADGQADSPNISFMGARIFPK